MRLLNHVYPLQALASKPLWVLGAVLHVKVYIYNVGSFVHVYVIMWIYIIQVNEKSFRLKRRNIGMV